MTVCQVQAFCAATTERKAVWWDCPGAVMAKQAAMEHVAKLKLKAHVESMASLHLNGSDEASVHSRLTVNSGSRY